MYCHVDVILYLYVLSSITRPSLVRRFFVRNGSLDVVPTALVHLRCRIRRLFPIHLGKSKIPSASETIRGRRSTYCSAVVASSHDLSSRRQINLGNRILRPRSPPR